ncbi:MAG: hypothetical protein WD187_02785 [Candidatus Woykebacteria bacterium]
MIKNFLKYSQKGASLIELLLYFSLLGIILTVTVDILFRTSEFSLESTAKGAVQDEARFIASRLTLDIHQADSIATPANLGNSTPILELSVDSETHTYTLTGSNLEYEEVGTGTQTANLNSNRTRVNSLTFERLGNSSGNHTIKITFEMENTTGQKGGPEIETFETVVGVR